MKQKRKRRSKKKELANPIDIYARKKPIILSKTKERRIRSCARSGRKAREGEETLESKQRENFANLNHLTAGSNEKS